MQKSKDTRYLDIHEDGQLDEAQLAAWVKQASQLPVNACERDTRIHRGVGNLFAEPLSTARWGGVLSMTTTAQAFLFNADAEGVSAYYGGDFETPFLQALSAVDPCGGTRSTVLLGDVDVSALCRRVTAVSREPRRSSHTEGHDMDLYRTIIWDLADALSGQWHKLDLEQFPMILGRVDKVPDPQP